MRLIFFLKKFLRKHLTVHITLTAVCTFLLLSCVGCKKSVNYFDYVSELRSNIFLAKTDALSLRIYAVCKESPYTSDGVPRETFSRMEVYLIAPEGNKRTEITLQLDTPAGGEMSYDIVKGEYYYACPIDVSKEKEIVCQIKYGEEEVSLTAYSVLTEDTITPQDALKKLQTEKAENFSSLTDKYGFSGEIHMRLLFEDSPYYYIGIIDRNGNCIAFLMNAESGKILAKRET